MSESDFSTHRNSGHGASTGGLSGADQLFTFTRKRKKPQVEATPPRICPKCKTVMSRHNKGKVCYSCEGSGNPLSQITRNH